MFSGRSTRIALVAVALVLLALGMWSERESLMRRLAPPPSTPVGTGSEPTAQTTTVPPASSPADFQQRIRIYLMLGGLAIGGFIVLLLSPGLALPLLILATAINRYRFDVASLGLRLEHLALAAVAGVWLVQFIRRKQRLRFAWDDAVLAFYWLLALIASYLNAPRFTESLKFLGLMGMAFAMYWLVKAFVRDDKTFQRMVSALLVVGAGEAVFGVVAWLLIPFGINLGVQYYPYSATSVADVACFNFTYSPYGTQFESNIFGSYTLGITLLLMTLWLSPANRTRRKLKLAGILIGVIAVALSLTRGALLGFIVGALAVLVLGEGAWRERIKSSALAIALLAITVLGATELPQLLASPNSPASVRLANGCTEMIRPQAFLTGTTSQEPNWVAAGEAPLAVTPPPGVSPESGVQAPNPEAGTPTSGGFQTLSRLLTSASVSYRLDSYVRALKDWLDHPWLGNGANAFAQKYITTSYTRDWIDNVELMALHDTGLIGLAVLLFWFVAGARDLVRAIRHSPTSYTRTALIGLALSFVGLLVAYQVTSALWLGFTWVQLGLMRAGTQILQRQPNSSAN